MEISLEIGSMGRYIYLGYLTQKIKKRSKIVGRDTSHMDPMGMSTDIV